MSKVQKKPGSSSDPGKAGAKKTTEAASKKLAELIVRPAKVNSSNCGKIYVSVDTLKEQGMDAGSYVQLQGNEVVALVTPHSLENDICKVSHELLELANMFPGDRLSLRKAAKPKIATKIIVQRVSESNAEELKSLLRLVGVVHTSQWIEESMKIIKGYTSLDDQLTTMSLEDNYYQISAFLITEDTEIEFLKDHVSKTTAFSNIGGLEKELDLLRTQTELPLKYPSYFARFNTEPERGILLYGPPGTGKTMLLKAIAKESGDAHVLRVNGPSLYSKYLGETESKLRSIFDEAQRFAPSIIFVDELDALVPKRDAEDTGETEGRVVATLLTLMDGMKPGGRVVVIGATNRPNKIDPALRRPGRFGHEVEIGTPDADGRRKILHLMLDSMPHHLAQSEIAEIADKSHGFVGADLQALVREAVIRVVKQGLQASKPASDMYVKKSDLDAAFLAVTPSAMREITLELPKVYWADIGGQNATIQRLRETVEWPLQRPEAFNRLGIRAPRGVLLYGPPGCSKTLLAKALATEVGLNFLAVKGPELFNKYVGESERAIREIFHKARQAAPSVIFFDEIDALSVSRGEAEAGGDRVLTSLLNEMDGIEALNEVVVLAATNRPDIIDSALMRPGRLDRLIYVSPPDLQARRQILLIQFSKMAIDDSVDLDDISEKTEGFSGAEIVNVCQEAGLLAMNEDPNVEWIAHHHFDAAIKGIRKTITPEVLSYFEKFAGISQ